MSTVALCYILSWVSLCPSLQVKNLSNLSVYTSQYVNFLSTVLEFFVGIHVLHALHKSNVL